MEVIHIILGLAIGFLMGFLTSYYRQKGKDAALLSDIKRLTEEKENVKSKFQLELETLLQIMPGRFGAPMTNIRKSGEGL